MANSPAAYERSDKKSEGGCHGIRSSKKATDVCYNRSGLNLEERTRQGGTDSPRAEQKELTELFKRAGPSQETNSETTGRVGKLNVGESLGTAGNVEKSLK